MLAWSEVEAIRERFASLNPYDPTAVPGSILKLEDANLGPDGRQRPLYCFAISAKRYALYTLDERGAPELVKWSEHGLGHLLNPTDPDSDDRTWMRQVWELLVREGLGLPVTEPAWLDRPAVTRTTVSSAALLHLFDDLNRGKPYADQVKPGNFLLSVATVPFGQPTDADPERFHLVAPYTNDARQWTKRRWIDRYSGKPYRIRTTGHAGSRGVARVQTYRDVLDAYRVHPEAKSAGPDGRPSTASTTGELQRLNVHPRHIRYAGKETNRLEEVECGAAQRLSRGQHRIRRPAARPSTGRVSRVGAPDANGRGRPESRRGPEHGQALEGRGDAAEGEPHSLGQTGQATSAARLVGAALAITCASGTEVGESGRYGSSCGTRWLLQSCRPCVRSRPCRYRNGTV